ncbi:ribosomal protein S18-alanine N-acetyltransferase [Methylovulum psychrotolerans]|jgi:ribosomal-protein-alanine N-acetyltransferase|uniref:[Ribosomal protein bS18]-alanine N-acetyltransferase n=1 Tax=Methylovulum psychrotolerans TaxID=1704499 RepID=A0A1Z4BUQ6_9GAMM|nr:ribosomal protein S18-alanine N-acetyltransferase [Methylovulum psychrotolerans]ASF44962.1 ribosomal-protein-alanine N-acetyltransferase [Methylovulum psychrotolerans]MBT9098232.1 ribosomal protein S18-alanine N-acetyltransferase [Methylovulum psychrotolerans]POZ53945.1 ribosomal-protein-alanine N-acetyltransferase [Methylovulum psychrotolerans]
MRDLFDKLKTLVVYDADKEFYAKVFPGSVPRRDLFRMRRMGMADLPQVLAIERQNYLFPWEEDIFEDCLKSGYSCWVCEELDRVLGYCLLSVAVGEAHILNISVDPAEQKQGIGRKMLQHLIDSVRGRAETVFLEVRPSNEVAIALYEDMGFNEIGIRKNYYPAENGREDAIMLALQLF